MNIDFDWNIPEPAQNCGNLIGPSFGPIYVYFGIIQYYKYILYSHLTILEFKQDLSGLGAATTSFQAFMTNFKYRHDECSYSVQTALDLFLNGHDMNSINITSITLKL